MKNSIPKMSGSIKQVKRKECGDLSISKVRDTIIHVIDPNTNQKKDFTVNQKVLMTRMEFFDNYISQFMKSKAYK